ncbi:uncharacterized protein LOC117945906 [Etheostoma cragini]|uniref:uncharacterized protein LOC117945906 n=1 Tax=Etheostoma cragini TaxID=417921 RepID=UPI00155E98B4|nr:uncharacterized protein LOC117945906 [Etheostoma cragini]
MDAENGELFLGAMATDGWQLDAPFSCSDLGFSASAKPLQDWAGDPDCTLDHSESEEVLHGVDPNEVFPSGLPADSESESDSGISEDPVAAESPVTTATAPATVYQVVYDISGLGGVKTEPGLENVISIELGGSSTRPGSRFKDVSVMNLLVCLPTANKPQRPDLVCCGLLRLDPDAELTAGPFIPEEPTENQRVDVVRVVRPAAAEGGSALRNRPTQDPQTQSN